MLAAGTSTAVRYGAGVVPQKGHEWVFVPGTVEGASILMTGAQQEGGRGGN